MQEESFIRTSNELNTAVTELLKSAEAINNTADKNNIVIRGLAHILVDESNGIIKTDNQDITDSFKEILEISRNIVRLLYEASHYECEIEREKKKIPVDVEGITTACKMFTLKKNLLIDYYKKLAESTEKVKNIGRAK